MIFESDLFPPIPFDEHCAYWMGELKLDELTLKLTVYIAKEIADAGHLAKLRVLVDALPELMHTGKAAILNQRDTELVESYARFHLDELSGFEREARQENPVSAALLRTRLVGVGCHPEGAGFRLTLDFGYPEHLSNELLAVSFDKDRNLLEVTHES